MIKAEKKVTSTRDPSDPKKKVASWICGVARWNDPETLAEAVKEYSEEKVLERFRAQIATDATNKLRAESVTPVSRDKVRQELIEDGTMFSDDVILSARGDVARQKARMEQLIDERITKKAEDRKTATAAAAADLPDSEEEES